MLYETLYTRDIALNPHPHMLDGHLVEDNGKRWTMKLRADQSFHDGTPVLARDCVASVRRWMASASRCHAGRSWGCWGRTARASPH